LFLAAVMPSASEYFQTVEFTVVSDSASLTRHDRPTAFLEGMP
jgi:hypothetical protein